MYKRQVQGYVGTSHAIRDTDYTQQVPTIDVPTLCIVGSEDGSTPPELVSELSSLIPGALFEMIDGAGHLPCIEKPEEFSNLVQPFLKKVASE